MGYLAHVALLQQFIASIVMPIVDAIFRFIKTLMKYLKCMT